MKQLSEFYPDLDVKKIESIESFHAQLAQNLSEELYKAKIETGNSIEILEHEIKGIDNQLKEMLLLPDAPTVAVDSLIDITTQINQLKEANQYYDRGIEIKKTIKEASGSLKEIKGRSLVEITAAINSKMAEINAQIYPDGRRPPVLTINGDSYRFDTFGDTGTGTAYVALITYDLSVLSLTCLPALAHDLPLIKNIENLALSNIVQIYVKSQKQIFISVDKLSSMMSQLTKF